jgi:hypothetical protein
MAVEEYKGIEGMIRIMEKNKYKGQIKNIYTLLIRLLPKKKVEELGWISLDINIKKMISLKEAIEAINIEKNKGIEGMIRFAKINKHKGKLSVIYSLCKSLLGKKEFDQLNWISVNINIERAEKLKKE